MRKAEVIFCSSFSFDTMQQCDLRILDAVRARDSSLVTHGTSHQAAAAAAEVTGDSLTGDEAE